MSDGGLQESDRTLLALIGQDLHERDPSGIIDADDDGGLGGGLGILQVVLVLLVASIPVAMAAVFSITMALGALALSKQRAIVSKLSAIEEMAGVDILCSDKTGTLTKNQLTLGDPILFSAKSAQDCILAAALASKIE